MILGWPIRHYLLLWVVLCPLQQWFEVIISVTCECDLIWKKGLFRCHQVNMRSYSVSVGPKSYEWCPYKMKEIWKYEHPGRVPWDHGGRDWNDESIIQGTLRIAVNHMNIKEARKGYFLEPSEGARPMEHVSFTLLDSKLLKNKILWFYAIQSVVIYYRA